MWQRFTEAARRTIVRAESHAALNKSAQVESEHLLLALLDETDGPGAEVLEQAGVTANKVQTLLEPEPAPVSLDYLLFQTEVEKWSEEFQVDAALIRRIESRLLFKMREHAQKLELKLSPQLKRVLELASDEARHIQETIQRPCGIGTEHLLLGLLRDKNGRAAEMLNRLGMNLEETRVSVIEHLRTIEEG